MNSENVNAEILTIGDELLIGQVIDTNSAWIAQQLNMVGINVYQKSSISDNKLQIINALDLASLRANLIIITGGLGPTKDDITKQCIASYFHTELIHHNPTLKHIIQLVESGNGEMNELNRNQALIPKICEVIPNQLGTAPGMRIIKEGIVFIFMPGVPFEMKEMMTNQIIPWLSEYFQTPSLIHKTYMLLGIAESSLAIMIENWENQLPPSLKLAYLPSPGVVRLRLTAKGDSSDKLTQIIDQEFQKIQPTLAPYLYSNLDESIEVTLDKILTINKKTIATAESCTGGKIASLITSIPGCSSYFMGSVVAYSNQIKSKILEVDEKIIDRCGAVSQEVVENMATNTRKIFNTDYAIATSGIAGPDGGSSEKPVGTTWIAVASAEHIRSKKYTFGDNRERNIQRASISALNELRKLILEEIELLEKKVKKITNKFDLLNNYNDFCDLLNEHFVKT